MPSSATTPSSAPGRQRARLDPARRHPDEVFLHRGLLQTGAGHSLAPGPTATSSPIISCCPRSAAANQGAKHNVRIRIPPRPAKKGVRRQADTVCVLPAFAVTQRDVICRGWPLPAARRVQRDRCRRAPVAEMKPTEPGRDQSPSSPLPCSVSPAHRPQSCPAIVGTEASGAAKIGTGYSE